MTQPIERLFDLYGRMLLIRRAEEKIREHYLEDEMKTPVHLSIGQEAVAVGVCDALGPEDRIVGTYRSHGLYLARTDDVDGFFAELYGRSTAPARGKAGSMHLAAPEKGLMMASAVVGTTIPVALGLAFAIQYRRTSGVGVSFFGDGAVDEGVFWESLNFACVTRLPMLFVCEDNGLAIHSPSWQRHGYRDLVEVARAFDCHVSSSDSADPLEISNVTRDLLARREGDRRPALLYAQCYRFVEHVGIDEDRNFHLYYRSQDEFEKWQAADPIRCLGDRLIEGGVPRRRLDELEAAIETRLALGVQAARAAPHPEPHHLFEDVWQ